MGVFTSPVLAFAGDPHDPRGAYALLASYDLFYTNDRGLTWQPLPFPPAGTGEDFLSTGQPYPLAQPDLVAHTFQPGLLFARAGNSLYRSRDGGQTWQILLDSVALFDLDYEGNELYAWRPDLPQDERGLYRSRDGGDTWRRTYRGYFPPALREAEERPATEGILSLMIDPTLGNSLLVGTHFGIFRSFNGGALWEEFNTGLPLTTDDAHQTPLLRVVGHEIYLLSETRDDSGQRMTFARLAHGQITPDQDHWEEIGGPDLSAYTGPAQPGFYGVYDLADRENNLYLATSSDLLASYDRGEHWQLLPGEEGAIYRLGINPSGPSELYAWTDGGLRMVTIKLKAMAETDEFAYLSAAPDRLLVLDLSVPASPVLAALFQSPGCAGNLAAEGQNVYVAACDAGLLMVQVEQ
jgi:hypothetical protein